MSRFFKTMIRCLCFYGRDLSGTNPDPVCHGGGWVGVPLQCQNQWLIRPSPTPPTPRGGVGAGQIVGQNNIYQGESPMSLYIPKKIFGIHVYIIIVIVKSCINYRTAR
jgi:hypothetical protein